MNNKIIIYYVWVRNKYSDILKIVYYNIIYETL